MTHTSYQCQECLRIDDQIAERRDFDIVEFWGERVRQVTVTRLCIHCGCDDLREVVMCEECDLDVALDGYDCCYACAVKAEDRERLADTLVDIALVATSRDPFSSLAHG